MGGGEEDVGGAEESVTSTSTQYVGAPPVSYVAG